MRTELELKAGTSVVVNGEWDSRWKASIHLKRKFLSRTVFCLAYDLAIAAYFARGGVPGRGRAEAPALA